MKVIVDKLPPFADRVGIDLEISGLRSRHLHRPEGRMACCAIALPSGDVHVLTKEKLVAEAMRILRGSEWVMHNASFDLRHLRRWSPAKPKQVWDTMLVERLLFSGYYWEFALQDVSRRWLKRPMDKSVRDLFIEGADLTPQMIRYNARDALTTLEVSYKQEKTARKEDLWLWRNLDEPMLWATMDFAGVPLNTDAWLALAASNARKLKRLVNELGFNPGSWQQVMEALRKVGVMVDSTGEGVLSQVDHPLARKVLRARELAKKVSTYGVAFVDDFVEDGRVFAHYNVTGARTGRTSSDDPNFQNILSESAYRSCFYAPRGMAWVKLDYGQQEMRVLAQRCQDPALLDALNSGEDVHQQVADQIATDRKTGKAIDLGLIFGLSPMGLARQLNIEPHHAEVLVRRYFNRFSGVERYIRECRGSSEPSVSTIYGRRGWRNVYSKQDRNQVLNYPIQGSAADMLKAALARIHREWPKAYGPFPVIALVHDELDLLIPKKTARRGMLWAKEVMLDEMHKMLPDVMPVVDETIGETWAG